MNNAPRTWRTVLLALSLLSGCAAAGSGSATADPRLPRGQSFSRTGAAGDFLAGRFAGAEGDLDTAADDLLKAQAKDPTNPELRQQAFMATLLAGQSSEAVRLARMQPDNQAAQLLLGDVEARNGGWEAAEQRFASLPKQGLTQVLQPLLVAWTQAGGGHTDRALGTLRPYVEGDRFRAVYAFHAAMIADIGGRATEAGRLYHLAQSEFAGPNLDLARALASWQMRNGQQTAAHQTIAAVIHTGDELGLAAARLQADAATRPVRNATDGIAESYLALAAALRQQDANDFAAVLLRLSLDLRPDFTAARLMLADVLGGGKRPDLALGILAEVSASDPLAPVVDLRRAALQDRAGNTEEALRTLARLEAAAPDRPEPWALQGAILRTKHRYPEAVAAYDRAVTLLGQPTRANWPLFYERGIAEERSHQWSKAEADFQMALKLSPDEPLVLNYLGYSWTEQNRNLPEARRMIERAAAARPNDGAITDSLGWIALREGDTAGAVRDLEKAVELQPEDATINGHLGDAYWAAGRKLEALYQWRRALTLNPDPEDVPKLEAKLQDAQSVAQPKQAQTEAPTAEKAQ
ncbi:MAG: tetratricopeptide repeat protein [Alphaproteobacteria bacterium]|nr:tetratricopeptide repeat protein [Alphaproteobacteria bacterium]